MAGGDARGGSERPHARLKRRFKCRGCGAEGDHFDQVDGGEELSSICLGWNEGCRYMFPIGRYGGTLDSAPFRRLAELVSFEDTGMRDFATPSSILGAVWQGGWC